MNALKVGDRLQDASIVIRDEDRLCYQVLSTSRGASGIRTISKSLLSEWVEAVRANPHAQGGELREKLCGKTEVDKFEYGYFATLKKMADMVLGNVPVIHAVSDFSSEFSQWFAANRGKGRDDTAKKYLGYFKTLTDSYQEPTHSYWHGLYKVMYGHDAEKEVSSIGELREFEKIYGGILPALEKKIVGNELNAEGCQRAIDWFWQPEVKPHTCVTSALNAYREFLKWREAQKKDNDRQLPDVADRLAVALRVFRSKRYDSEWQAKVAKDGYGGIFDWGRTSGSDGMDRTSEVDGVSGIGDIAAMSIDEFKANVLDRVWAFQNGGSRKWGQLNDGEKSAYRAFVAGVQRELKPFGAYFPTDRKCPRGMGIGMISELLMRFWPDSCCSYNEGLIWDGLVSLGLAGAGRVGLVGRVGRTIADSNEFVWPKNAAVYQEFMGICAHIQQQMVEMGFGRTPRQGDKDEPNYLTVNEFLWFVHDYKDLLKEEMMKTEFKSVSEKRKPKSGQKKLSDMMKDPLMLRLAAALRTKPFAILAGHSGTGKSQMVRRLAYMTCADEGLMAEANEGNAPGNYCMIQVKPNWHDSTDLLGYYSEIGKKYRTTDFVRFVMKAYAYPEVPFFVCLDEMNLAPVEQYFAEYLSALESASDKSGCRLTDPLLPNDYDADEVADNDGCRFTESKAWYEAHGLTLPKNLFVVGTVNMDDTTCQFSRKVLDRAMTIMMDQVKFEEMMNADKSKEPDAGDLLGADDVAKFLGGKLRADPLTTHQVTLLNAVENVLGKTPFAVAYRFANEYALYEASLLALTGKESGETLAKEAIDHCVLMKVLPRIHGEKKELINIFRGNEKENGLEQTLGKDDTLSGKKMEEILERKQSYLSFWP